MTSLVKFWCLSSLCALLLGSSKLPAKSNASPSEANAIPLDPQQLSFAYQEALEPWALAKCEHLKADEFFGWDVVCILGGHKYRYRVHLVVSFYSKTRYGNSAHEILYWVTDISTPNQLKFHSTTLWIHHSQPDDRARVLEMAQGVENDLAQLRLAIDLR